MSSFFLDLIYARRLPYAVFFLDPFSLLFFYLYFLKYLSLLLPSS